ncbi:Glycoside/pentoside/hexuronide:cation symporter, GPH family [Kosakonia sp. BK9b]|uniref:MFS transporter n=1 Tax=Kosakonia sp. TaxID=1916651 RepID=UPI0028A2BEA4|nr:MFS transporter [Kosakonia sp.]
MKLTIREKIGFGAGDMAISIVMMSMQLIVAYFYTDIFKLKAADVGLLLLTVRVLDAIIDPLIGMITDKTSSRWGRYRPYLLIFAIPFGITILLMFITPDFSYLGKLIWAYATYILLTLAYTFIAIPYVSVIGVITDDSRERLSANTYRFVMTKIGMFLVSIIVPFAAAKLGEGNLASGYQIAMAAMGALGTLLCFYCFFTIKERITHTPSRIPLSQQFRSLLRNDQWMILGIVILVIMLGGSVRSAVAAYYAKYYLNGGDALIPLFLTTGVVASILSMFGANFAAKRMNKLTMFRISQAATFIFSAVMFMVVGRDALVLAFIFYFIITFLADMQLPVYWASIAEAVDYGEVKNKERVSGLAFGGILFFQKLGMGLAGGLVGYILSYANYTPDSVQPDTSLAAISLMMTLIPGVFHLLVAWLMRKFIIDDEYYQTIRAQLVKE